MDWDKIDNPTKNMPIMAKGFTRIEDAFTALYMNTPAKRFVGSASIITLIMYLTKPAISFDQKSGQARPFVFPDPNVPGGTPMPYWMPGVLIGSFTALFI